MKIEVGDYIGFSYQCMKLYKVLKVGRTRVYIWDMWDTETYEYIKDVKCIVKAKDVIKI